MALRPQRAKNGGRDDYLTLPDVANRCVELLVAHLKFKPALVVEPSAGAGDFVFALQDRGGKKLRKAPIRAIDIHPLNSIVTKGDWFNCFEKLPKKTVVAGNPPWGMSASMAIKFFNHAAHLHAKVIAFIVPMTFRKASILKRLSDKYELVSDTPLARKSFYVYPKRETVEVPSCFQIWKRLPKGEHRRKPENHTPTIFTFTKAGEDWDYAVRRVGGRAGKLLDRKTALSASTTLFLKAAEGKHALLGRVLRQVDFSAVKDNTAGVRSVSKGELASAVAKLTAVQVRTDRRSINLARARASMRPVRSLRPTRLREAV